MTTIQPKTLRRSMVAAAACLLAPVLQVGAPAAAAACPKPTPARTIASTSALIESAAIDDAGRMYYGDLSSRKVFRLDAPGATPRVFTTITEGTGVGGIAIGADGRIFVGGSTATALLGGDQLRAGTISVVNPKSGVIEAVSRGFSATSGLAVARNGTAYATNDLGSIIGTRSASGVVDPAWATLPSANGGVISADGRWLYVSRSFIDPGVSRIDLTDPTRIQNVWRAPSRYALSSPDGLALDDAGRPVVPMNSTGEIVRIDGAAPNQVCTLATGLLASTQVIYGRGESGFAQGHLYRVGFDGRIMEIPAGRQSSHRPA